MCRKKYLPRILKKNILWNSDPGRYALSIPTDDPKSSHFMIRFDTSFRKCRRGRYFLRQIYSDQIWGFSRNFKGNSLYFPLVSLVQGISLYFPSVSVDFLVNLKGISLYFLSVQIMCLKICRNFYRPRILNKYILWNLEPGRATLSIPQMIQKS